MKNYKVVVRERYDKQKYDKKGIMNNIYAPINPVGFYGEFKAAQILRKFVLMLNSQSKSLDTIKICDCGCGDGVKTRVLAELLGNPKQIYGVEYSKNRLEHCRNMNPFIHYEYMDLVEYNIEGIPFGVQFDGIVTFVVFTHFNSEKEIINALKNIHNSLKRKGLFLWYELSAKSHWEGKEKSVQQWGFSSNEMDKYALNVGFKLVEQFEVYTKIPILNISIGYLIKNVRNIWLLELLEKLPLKKNNIVKIYRKD